MTTIVATVVGAIVASLQESPAVATDVWRVRFAPTPPDVAAAVAVRPVSCEPDVTPLAYGVPGVWLVRVALELTARATADDANTAELRLDALLQATLNRLLADPTLADALPLGMEPTAITYEFDAAGDQLASCTLQLLARMRAQPNLT